VGAALEHSDPVHKVTIIPRGRAGGLTFFLPEDDRTEYSENWCRDTVTQALGGRVAEELVLQRMGSGAQQDIQMASKLVRRMVMQWGMSKLGPIAFGDRDEQIFLGREIAQHTDYSESTAKEIDTEVKRIIDVAYDRAKEILEERIDVLHAMAAALLERETLDAGEILTLLDGRPLAELHAPPAETAEKPEADTATEPEKDAGRKEFPGGIPPLADPDPST